MTYDPIYELETDDDNDNIVPYELIIMNLYVNLCR